MHRYLPIILGVVLIVGLTVVQGVQSFRWSDVQAEAEDLAKPLELVPMEFGDWIGEDDPVSDEIKKTSGAVGCVNRSYKNKKTGEIARLWLICGRTAHIIDHTPNVCYPGQGYHQEKKQSRYPMTVDEETCELYTTTFRRESHQGVHRERVYWGWARHPRDQKEGARWIVPPSPRRAFQEAAIYKIMLTSSIPHGSKGDEMDDNPGINFARDLMPELETTLFQQESELPADSTSPDSTSPDSTSPDSTSPDSTSSDSTSSDSGSAES